MLALAILSVFETMKHSNCLSSVLIQFLVNGYVYNQRLYFSVMNSYILASQVVLLVKNPHVNAGNIRDVGLIPGSGRSSGGGHGNPLHYSCLENPMHRGAWWATVHRIAKSQMQLKVFSTHTCIHLFIQWTHFGWLL